jgi:hypothetical protein
MTERESFPDDVPVGDAVEQLRSVAEPAEPERIDDDAPPLESNESDWQEQRQVVEYPDEDEIR